MTTPPNPQPPTPASPPIRDSYLRYVEHYRDTAPLYHRLAAAIADDDELLALAAHSRPGQPAPNMLNAAVQYLLMGAGQHPLAAYYPTLGGARAPDERAFPLFRDFCRQHQDAIIALLEARLTQTNETRRCAYLMPAFAAVAGVDAPLALIEVGPSAGLNLIWDRYQYTYGDGRSIGDPAAPVRIETELRGPSRPPLPARLPQVAWRVGIDLNPVDLQDADAVRWLEALVWPEHTDRLARLRAAIGVARAARPPIVAGDALQLLPDLIAAAPPEAALCVYHTHVTYQFTPAMREQLDQALRAASRRRPIARVACEQIESDDTELTLTRYHGGVAETRLLARTTGHANWLMWQL